MTEDEIAETELVIGQTFLGSIIESVQTVGKVSFRRVILDLQHDLSEVGVGAHVV